MRVSVTHLEAFRLWKQPDNDWFRETDLIAQIRGESRPSAAMTLGIAVGQVLEDPTRYAVSNGLTDTPASYQHYLMVQGQRVPTHTFSADTMAPAIALFDYTHGLFEVKAQKRYFDDIDVVAKVDYILGTEIGENKTTEQSVEFDKYFASAQWRFYLDIFAAPKVTYNVFQLKVEGDSAEVEIKDIVRFSLYTYPAVHQDCCALLEEFVAYVTHRKLDAFLRAKQRDAA